MSKLDEAVRHDPKNHSHAIRMHRLVNKTPDGFETDHINRNKSDNRKSNLRTVSVKENAVNKGLRKDNKSGFKGVSWDKENNKWNASVGFNGKQNRIGRFNSKTDAIKAYNKAVKKYHGDFAHLNDL